MKIKEVNRVKLLEYLSNPENEFIQRVEFSSLVFGKKQKNYVYKHFTPDELEEIEITARELRRKRLIRKSVKIDDALINDCLQPGCDAATRKLYYEVIEGRKPGLKIEADTTLSGNDGSNKWILEVHQINKEKDAETDHI